MNDPPTSPTPSPSLDGLRQAAADRYVDAIPLGEGGMGIVYAVHDRELERDVALKILRPDRAAGAPVVTPSAPLTVEPSDAERTPVTFERRVGRFLREARLTAGMTHPGVPPVFEVGRTPGGLPYYTMRLVEGGRTLADEIERRRDRRFEERADLLEIFARVCDAVAYAHAHGIVHRDLKPSNVALGAFGEVVVIDWGLGRSLRAAPLPGTEGAPSPGSDPAAVAARSDPASTSAAVIGTPGYMAPEALGGDAGATDTRADVFSLGATMFELLTGRLPHAAASVEAYRASVAGGPAIAATAADPAVPTALSLLCARALVADRSDRTISVAELGEGVRAWQRRSAIEHEVDRRLCEVTAALEGLDGLDDAAFARRLASADDALRRARALAPDAGASLCDDLARAREALTARRIRSARSRWRRRTASVLAAAAALAGVGVGAALESRRRDAVAARAVAETARASALASRERAEGLLDFLVTDIADEVEPVGRLGVLVHLGDRARRYHASLGPNDQTTTSLSNRATALRRLGEVHELRGDLPAARAAYEEALAAAEGRLLLAPEAPDARSARSLVAARLGRLALAAGRPRRAADALRAHLLDVDAALVDRPDDPALLDARADALATLGRIELVESAWREARTSLEQAVEAARRAVDAAPGSSQLRVHRAQRLLDRATVLRTTGDAARSLSISDEVRTLAAAELELAPDDVRWVRVEADAIGQAADASSTANPDALARAVATFRRLVARDPENRSDAVRLAEALRRVGDQRIAVRDLVGSREPFAEAFRIVDGLQRLDPRHGIWAHLLVTACDRVVASRRGSPDATNDDSLALRRRALDVAEQLARLDGDDVRWRHVEAYASYTLGVLLRTRGDSEGERRLLQAVRSALAVADTNPEDLEIAHLLGMASRSLLPPALAAAPDLAERTALSESAIERMAHAARARPDVELPHTQLLATRVALAEFLDAAGERDRAVRTAQEAIDGVRSLPVSVDPAATTQDLARAHAVVRGRK